MSIIGFTGLPGQGKSYSMIARALRFRGKRPIYSNMDLTWAEDFRSVKDLFCIHNALVLLDEAGIWCNSREWQKFGIDAVEWFSQHRKHGCDLIWTSQAAESVDSHIRRLTLSFAVCSRIGQLVTQQWVDGPSMKKLNKTWLWLNPRVYNEYDTMMMVGRGDGSGHVGQGAAAVGAAERWVADVLKGGALVREQAEGPGAPDFVRYRPATLLDIARGRCVLSRFGSGRLREVPLPEGIGFDTLRNLLRVPDDATGDPAEWALDG